MEKPHQRTPRLKAFSSIFWLSSAFLFLAHLPSGCGTETGNPVIKKPTTPRIVAQDAVESELLEVSDSALDTGNSVSSLRNDFALTDSSVQFTHSHALAPAESLGAAAQQSNTCLAEGNKVTATTEKTLKTLRRTVERKTTSVWESPQAAISCASDNSIVRKFRLLEGTSEERSGSVNRTLELPLTASKNGYQKTASNTAGTWKTVFDSLDIGETEISAQKTVSWSLKKSESFRTSEGNSSIQTETKTAPDAPLKILVTRNRDSGLAIKSTQIQSGTTLVTTADGASIEISFENIVFSGNGDCYPTSGFLRGKLTPSGGATENFTIDFSAKTDGTPTMTYVDGESVPLSGVCFD
jgi:hypothetical protein